MARWTRGTGRAIAGTVAVAAMAAAMACTSPVTATQDATTGTDEGTDARDVAFPKDGTVADTPTSCPGAMATIRFQVDDRANHTYADGRMKWTGSFAWDAATNTIAYATSWLPTDGPFPKLYDDGPASAGGHEAEGATAGDHVFQVEVEAASEEETTFDYGVLNEFDRWIWVGPNGQFTVPRCATGPIDAAPLVLPPFGTTDLKVTLDLNALDPKYASINLDEYDVYLKSSANSWTPVQLVDDGDASRGDDTAGDGVVTFVQSKRLGTHDGLLYDGQHVQFVFAFAAKGMDADSGQEYKDGTTVLATGVQAFTDAAQAGTFAPADVVWERAARGKEFNTTVIVGGGQPWCAVDADCFGGVTCGAEGCDTGSLPPVSTPAIASLDPATGPAAGGTAVTITGTDFREGATVTFDGTAATDVAFVSATEVHATSPAHAAGAVDVVLANPDGGHATAAGAFAYTGDQPPQSQPVLRLIDPVKGPVSGGTQVTLTGTDFREGCTVTFGGLAGTDVAFVSDTEVHATTPAHAKGTVDVVLRNADGGTATYPAAYEFLEPQAPPVADWGRLDPPLSLDVDVGAALPDVFGEAYEPDVTTGGGCEGLVAAQVGWGPAGSDPRAAAAGWSWAEADYDGAGGDSGNNAVFRGQLGATAAGTYAYTFRFSLDGGVTWLVVDSDGTSADGSDFSTAALGSLTRTQPDPEAPAIGALAPAWGASTGGGTVTLSGQRLAGVASVDLGGVAAAATVAGDGNSLTFTVPAHPAGVVAVSVTNGAGKTASKAAGFAFAPKAAAAPTVDGALDDWDPTWKVAENGAASDWDPDPGTHANDLAALWVAYTDTDLYVAVQGRCEAANAIVAFLDRDLGTGSGLHAMSALTDGSAGLDDALSCGLDVGATGFGAEKAVGTRGMASFACVDPGNQAGGEAAGWRDLATPADLGWDCGEVAATADGFEARLPLATFLGGAMPAAGTELGVVVRLVSGDGMAASNQSLPQIGGPTWTQNTVVDVPLR